MNEVATTQLTCLTDTLTMKESSTFVLPETVIFTSNMVCIFHLALLSVPMVT